MGQYVLKTAPLRFSQVSRPPKAAVFKPCEHIKGHLLRKLSIFQIYPLLMDPTYGMYDHETFTNQIPPNWFQKNIL